MPYELDARALDAWITRSPEDDLPPPCVECETDPCLGEKACPTLLKFYEDLKKLEEEYA